MACMGCRKLSDLFEKDLTQFMEQLLPPDCIKNFRAEAPSHFKAPTDSRFQIHYPSDRAPYVEIRLQELFGTKENPKLLFGTTPLQFHLLGPNYRPVQVTSDIASFWKNTYPEVRKELRARYPKHSWPDDPTTAPAVKKGRSQKN
jgi:ATP-dependent helicase HrpB